MSDVTVVRNRIDNLDVSPRFDSYGKVIIHVSDETTYEYPIGTTSGRTLEIDNPFGTQQMAQDLYNRLQGYQYQPFNADGTQLDPSVEMGDALSATRLYGGIYARNRTFSRLMKANVAAPQDEEINHEYEYVSATERMFARQFDDVKATFAIQNDKIEARVEADTSGNKSTFGWRLKSDSWEVFASNKTVLKATEEGLEVNGKVTATSGTIGGFEIGSRAIYNNMPSMDATATSGVYLGTDGIKLGQNFKVTTSGVVTASSMRLKGMITFLNDDGTSAGTLSAANLRKFADDAYSSACKSDGYCYKGAGGGYSWNNAKVGNEVASYFTANRLGCTSFYLNGAQIGTQYLTYTDGAGNSRSATFVTAH